MLKLIPAFAALFLTSAVALAQSDRVERLRDVKSVYVTELGQTEKAKVLRQEIIRRLAESQRIRVVDASDEADAVLSVSIRDSLKNVDEAFESFGDPGIKTSSKVLPTTEIVFRLSSHQNRTLWVARFSSESFTGKNERQSGRALASKLSRQFLKAVERDRQRRR